LNQGILGQKADLTPVNRTVCSYTESRYWPVTLRRPKNTKRATALSDLGQRLFSALPVYVYSVYAQNEVTLSVFSIPEGVASFGFQTTSYVMRPAMQQIEIQEYAQQLFETHGDKAVVVAAKKARSFEEGGNSKEAKTWRHIEAALKLMRGPKES
jgi:hypothetical protein